MHSGAHALLAATVPFSGVKDAITASEHLATLWAWPYAPIVKISVLRSWLGVTYFMTGAQCGMVESLQSVSQVVLLVMWLRVGVHLSKEVTPESGGGDDLNRGALVMFFIFLELLLTGTYIASVCAHVQVHVYICICIQYP